MNWKQVLLLFIFIALITGLLSNAAYAAEEDKGSLSGVADTIQNMFGFLPNIITLDKMIGEDAAAMFWARFLVWLLLFAVTYFGAGFVFKDNKRIATVVALVISLMGSLLMPDAIVVKLFQTYGFLSGLIIWVAPVLGGFFVVSKIKPKLVKALIYLIILFVLMSIDKSITSNFGKDLVDNTWYSFFRLLLAVVIIAFLWNLLTAWMDGGGDEGWRGTSWNWPTGHDDGRRDGGHDRRDDGRGPRTPRGPRPAGPMPAATPPSRHPTDPPTPSGGPPPGLYPQGPGPRPTVTRIPKRPKIPDEEQIFIDLSGHFNPIRSQDGLGACTAFAATSIFEYILHAGYGMQRIYLSPLFLWYKTREAIGAVNDNIGPRTCAVPMVNLVRDGVCFEDIWSFVAISDPKWQRHPDEQAVVDADWKKILNFGALDKNDPDQWVYALLEKYPINIGVKFPTDMRKPYNKKLYDNFGARQSAGGHAMVIVGYHSHYPYQGQGIKAFKVRNSHDVDWGENGYTWVPAEILKDMMYEDPIIIDGWKKEGHDKPKTESDGLLERIKKYAKEEKDWLDKEYKYLHSLKEHIDREDYKSANEILSAVKRSENAAEAFEKRIESNLLQLIEHIQEPQLKSLIAAIKKELMEHARSLTKFTSEDEKYIKEGIDYLIKNSLQKDEEYQRIRSNVQRLVGIAINILRALEKELDKLLNLEEEIKRSQKH